MDYVLTAKGTWVVRQSKQKRMQTTRWKVSAFGLSMMSKALRFFVNRYRSTVIVMYFMTMTPLARIKIDDHRKFHKVSECCAIISPAKIFSCVWSECVGVYFCAIGVWECNHGWPQVPSQIELQYCCIWHIG